MDLCPGLTNLIVMFEAWVGDVCNNDAKGWGIGLALANLARLWHMRHSRTVL